MYNVRYHPVYIYILTLPTDTRKKKIYRVCTYITQILHLLLTISIFRVKLSVEVGYYLNVVLSTNRQTFYEEQLGSNKENGK